MKKTLTCIECPMGCTIEAELDGERVLSVTGNSCPRGKAYAESEVVCPRRVVTSVVRAANGTMVPVKTSEPVKRKEMFAVMNRIVGVHPELPVRIGDVLYPNISEDADLIASGNAE